MKRRDFNSKSIVGGTSIFSGLAFAANLSCSKQEVKSDAPGKLRKIIFRTHSNKLGIINEDGTGLEYLNFNVPGQINWGYGPSFKDGKRIVVTSWEDGKLFKTTTMSHIWIYNFEDKSLTEIADKNRPADFHVPCALLPDETRIVTNPAIDGEQRVFVMNLDGSEQVEVTKKGEGYTYGVSLSPDGKRLAFHVTNVGPLMPYSVYVIGIDGSNRKLIVTHPDHLYFGTSWSNDGEWVLFQDCHFKTDPGHDWSDLYIGRPDGSENKMITSELRHWFGTSYGNPETKGNGSNMPQWSPIGPEITYTRAKPDSQTAWQWAKDRPDTDHFNRDYKPEEAWGGTDICLINPFTEELKQITKNEPLIWDFRTAWSPDGERIVFCRAKVGLAPELWIMDADGKNQKFLTRGEFDNGVDHPKFLL